MIGVLGEISTYVLGFCLNLRFNVTCDRTRERRSAQRQISSEEVLHQESLTGDNRRGMAVNSINNQDTINHAIIKICQ